MTNRLTELNKQVLEQYGTLPAAGGGWAEAGCTGDIYSATR